MSIFEPVRFVHRISILCGLSRLLAVFAIVYIGPVMAADFSGDLSVDSAIEMTTETGDEIKFVRISTVLSATQVSISGSMPSSEAEMPYQQCSDLWQYLLDRDVGTLTDAPVEDPMPDQASFTFTFRSGTETNTFSAYGVDFLSDSRYKEIAMAIMKTAKEYE